MAEMCPKVADSNIHGTQVYNFLIVKLY